MNKTATISRARFYDVGLWLLTLGRESRLRERLLAPISPREGEAVLDVGCGTGTLALLAKRKVGASGTVTGVDASEQMIARARAKAERAKSAVRFEQVDARKLPFADQTFDVALCTVMLHHVPRADRRTLVTEIRRVLRPGGRLLLADFVFGKRRSVIGLLHHHVGLRADELADLAVSAGFTVGERESLGMFDIQYVVARLLP